MRSLYCFSVLLSASILLFLGGCPKFEEVPPECNPECLNEGVCIDPDLNICDCTGTGYTGEDCGVPVCNPACQNGGVCTAPGTCDCTGTGYEGDYCQIPEGGEEPVCVPECENGICVEGNICVCSSGYEGDRCEIPVCSPACQNGGVCTSPGTCDCTGTGFTGDYCEIPEENGDPVCDPGCRNGGICIEDNLCSCPPGYEGDYCEIRLFFCSPDSPERFLEETWWFAADAHIGSHRDNELNALSNLQSAIADVNSLGISHLAVMLGDFVHDSPDHIPDYENAMSAFNHSWIDVLGNHDFDRYGNSGRVKHRTYFSLTMAGIRFIALSDDGRWNGGNVITAYQTEKNLMQDQDDWFRTELDREPGRPTILLTHQGLWRYYTNPSDDGPCFWDTNRRGWLKTDWENYNIPMWFRGHNHAWRLNENYQGLGVVDVSPGATANDSGGGIFMTLKRENGTTGIELRFRELSGNWRTLEDYSAYEKELITAVYNWHDLDNIRNRLDGNYILMNDLDSGSPGYSDYNSGNGWEPLGTISDPFTGSFDGRNHKVSGLSINRPTSRNGLFGHTENAFIYNLGLTDVNISSTDSRAGALAGEINNTIVSNCYSGGNISLTGRYNAGGLIGRASGRSIVFRSWSTADVLHDWSDGAGSNAGGLVGRIGERARIIESFATGNVTGNSNVGGLAGRSGGTDEHTSVLNSYAWGNVSGSGSRIGGLAGRNYGDIINSYSTGSVSGNSSTGGLTGINEAGASVEDSFWDTESSGNNESSAGAGRTTAQMKNPDTFSAWDMTAVWTMDASYSDGYPFQQASRFHRFEIENWHDLDNIRNRLNGNYILMNDLDENTPGYDNYNTGNGWEPIGLTTAPFSGSFDGKEHVIRGLNSSRTSSRTGLFGYAENASIRNLGLQNVNISATDSNIGAIVGEAVDSRIENCFSTGEISSTGRYNAGGLLGRASGRTIVADSWSSADVFHDWSDGNGANTGGLVGRTGESAQLLRVYSTGNVSGHSNTGGLAGRSGGSDENTIIMNSYSRSNVSGTGTRAGGLIGRNYGIVFDTFSSGSVTGDSNAGGLIGVNESTGTALAGFWDTQTSGIEDSSAGSGRSSAVMKDYSIYITAGWNFASYWAMDASVNDGYPHLLHCQTN